MVGDFKDIHCNKCGKYLFTEKDTVGGCQRENDNKNYAYDVESDTFICEQCK